MLPQTSFDSLSQSLTQTRCCVAAKSRTWAGQLTLRWRVGLQAMCAGLCAALRGSGLQLIESAMAHNVSSV